MHYPTYYSCSYILSLYYSYHLCSSSAFFIILLPNHSLIKHSIIKNAFAAFKQFILLAIPIYSYCEIVVSQKVLRYTTDPRNELPPTKFFMIFLSHHQIFSHESAAPVMMSRRSCVQILMRYKRLSYWWRSSLTPSRCGASETDLQPFF
jgi:hypothetical protein